MSLRSLIIVSILVWASYASGSCYLRYTHELFENADEVFTGSVVQKEVLRPWTPRACAEERMTFKVDEVFKGDVKEEYVLTLDDGCFSEGANFKEGRDYLLYIKKVSGKATTSFCSGTQVKTTGNIQSLKEAMAVLVTGGIYHEYYEDGKLQREITLKDGRVDGPVNEYDPTGKLMPPRTGK